MYKLVNDVKMYKEVQQKVTKTGKTLKVIGEISVPRRQRKRVQLANGTSAFVDTYNGYLDIEGPDGRVFSILVNTFQGKVEILQPREETVQVIADTAEVETY